MMMLPLFLAFPLKPMNMMIAIRTLITLLPLFLALSLKEMKLIIAIRYMTLMMICLITHMCTDRTGRYEVLFSISRNSAMFY